MTTQFQFECDETFPVDGTGLYTEYVGNVRVNQILVEDMRDDNCGVLCYLKLSDWDPARSDIYTDRAFRNHARKYLAHLFANSVEKYDWSKLDYTEAGMQSDYVVSMEILKWKSVDIYLL